MVIIYLNRSIVTAYHPMEIGFIVHKKKAICSFYTPLLSVHQNTLCDRLVCPSVRSNDNS